MRARLVAAVFGIALLRALLSAASGASLHVDEAQYWDWSRHLQWGYYSKPPAVAALIAASRALFGDSEPGLRALAMLCWPLTALVLASLARAMAAPAQREAAAPWAALLFMLSPLAALLGQVVTTDALLMLAWALALHGLWSAVMEGRPAGWWVYAAALGLGLLDKFTMLALLPGAAVWCARAGGRAALARWVLATAAGVAALTPHLLWNAAAGWPTLQHTADITVRSGQGQGWLPGEALGYLAAQLMLVAPVAGPWLLARRAWRGAGWRPGALAALAWLHGPLLAAGVYQAAKGHAELNWVGPAHLAGILVLANWAAGVWPQVTAGWKAWGAQALLVTLLAGGWCLFFTGGAMPPEVLARADVWARMRGWREALAKLAARAPELSRPGTVLIADTRNLAALTAYHWRSLPLVRTMIPADGRPGNHYQLQCPWHRGLARGGAVFLVTEEAPSPAWAARLGGLEPAGEAPLIRWGREAGRLQLWRLRSPEAAADAPRDTGGCTP